MNLCFMIITFKNTTKFLDSFEYTPTKDAYLKLKEIFFTISRNALYTSVIMKNYSTYKRCFAPNN